MLGLAAREKKLEETARVEAARVEAEGERERLTEVEARRAAEQLKREVRV